MAGSQVATGISIINSLSGFFSLSLTNFDNDSLPAIAAGSKVEVAGAFFTFNAETAIDPTNWAGISSNTMAYIMLTPSGTPGSQTIAASWRSTAPVWVDSKQGWYASAASSVRCIGGVCKYSSTGYCAKFVLNDRNTIKTRYANTGPWNMDLVDTKSIPGQFPHKYITSVNAVIYNDSGGVVMSDNFGENYIGVFQRPVFTDVSANSINVYAAGSAFQNYSTYYGTTSNRCTVQYSYRVI